MNETTAEQPTGSMRLKSLLSRSRPVRYVALLAILFFVGTGAFWLLKPTSPQQKLEEMGFQVEQVDLSGNKLLNWFYFTVKWDPVWKISTSKSTQLGEKKLGNAVGALNDFHGARFLFLHDCEQLADLQGIAKSRRVSSLFVKNCINLQSLQGVESTQGLEQLICQDCPGLEVVPSQPHLFTLRLSNCPQVRDFSFLNQMPNLHFLNLENCGNLPTAEQLSSVKKLNHLRLTGFKQLSDIERFKQLPKLQELHLEGHSIPPAQIAALKTALPKVRITSK